MKFTFVQHRLLGVNSYGYLRHAIYLMQLSFYRTLTDCNNFMVAKSHRPGWIKTFIISLKELKEYVVILKQQSTASP